MAFDDLNPLLHSQLRLAIMSLLISVKEADYKYIKEETRASSGNISVQMSKLEDAGYVEVTKTFKDNKPNTSYTITPEGIEAFETYVNTLQQYLDVNSNDN
ncbi:Winged helix DNA-binding domain-containing protein [Fodinibius salinus]|uniref:Winged helix DNA-binding domain-containing protein n=1 Tax=Fodinibius salinus TaxID=860790 RepID=A0A5D3YF24_9BACT|nr:transcriptional regulator [Fodinibius salinus]TYP91740.1 Winged helix DNA-binding domain-containing protein [Fodinibius salinus]